MSSSSKVVRITAEDPTPLPPLEELAVHAPERMDIPRDPEDERYVLSFRWDADDATSRENICSFFAEYGFVVISDVMDDATCTATIDDIWDYMGDQGVIRDDHGTWGNAHWPGIRNEGIVGSGAMFRHRLILNRMNPTIFGVYGALLGVAPEDLAINHDRVGLFRPTQLPDDPHPEWSTRANLHLDMNPFDALAEDADEQSAAMLDRLRYRGRHVLDCITENNHIGSIHNEPPHIQGLINLMDNTEEDGGFQLVPGFHKRLAEWAEATRGRLQYMFRGTFNVLPEALGFTGAAHRITARAGSMVLWDQRTVHGSRPNVSARPRYAQFIKVFPRHTMTPERARARAWKIAVKIRDLEMADDLTELAEHVFGFADFGGYQAVLDAGDPVSGGDGPLGERGSEGACLLM